MRVRVANCVVVGRVCVRMSTIVVVCGMIGVCYCCGLVVMLFWWHVTCVLLSASVWPVVSRLLSVLVYVLLLCLLWLACVCVYGYVCVCCNCHCSLVG